MDDFLAATPEVSLFGDRQFVGAREDKPTLDPDLKNIIIQDLPPGILDECVVEKLKKIGTVEGKPERES